MKYFQLFSDKPNIEFLEILLECYGLHGLDEKKEFTKVDLVNLDTVNKIIELIPELVLYYLPCKSLIYLNNITEKRTITILSQFLKLYDYKLSRKERIHQKKKSICYNVMNNKFANLHISNSPQELFFS
jgi:hypothetical protein